MTCQEVVELVTSYLEGTMAADVRARFEEHLVLCDGCDRYVRQIRRTIELIGEADEELTVPEHPGPAAGRVRRLEPSRRVTPAPGPSTERLSRAFQEPAMPDTGFTNLFVVALVAFLAPLTVAMLPRLRVPSVVLEIVAGVVLGRDPLGDDLPGHRAHPASRQPCPRSGPQRAGRRCVA